MAIDTCFLKHPGSPNFISGASVSNLNPMSERRRDSRRFIVLVLLGIGLHLQTFASPKLSPQLGDKCRQKVARLACGRPSQLYKEQSDDFLATEGERIYSDADTSMEEDSGYAFDDEIFNDDDKPEDIGPVHYYGVTDAGEQLDAPKTHQMQTHGTSIWLHPPVLQSVMPFQNLNLNPNRSMSKTIL